jgi:hypothetical protein
MTLTKPEKCLISIVSHICSALIFTSMRFNGFAWIAAVFLVMVALAAGCTAPQAPGTPAAATPAAVSTASAAPATAAASVTAAKTADIDTVITVHYNDIACLNVQNEIGKTYLYPDEKYTLYASSPGVANVNVNVILVDENDSLAIREIKPQWDAVQKKWVYEGIVPLVQFNDITVPVEKTFTVKSQSKYYICVDDRKEAGANDVMLRVPVKLKRV